LESTIGLFGVHGKIGSEVKIPLRGPQRSGDGCQTCGRTGDEEKISVLAVRFGVMDSATESYLATLAKDSTIWRRKGKYGAICFIDGVIEALIATAEISDEEASQWNTELKSSPSAPPSKFAPTVESPEAIAELNSTQDFPHFLELIPVEGAVTIVPGVCSIQILGIERYDSKAAIIWRVVPLTALVSQNDLSDYVRFETGPNRTSMKLTDDIGTRYILVGGHSGGRIERVGRFEFRPPPPDNATILFVRWEDVEFNIALPRTDRSGA
jgi:hypothetical protein